MDGARSNSVEVAALFLIYIPATRTVSAVALKNGASRFPALLTFEPGERRPCPACSFPSPALSPVLLGQREQLAEPGALPPASALRPGQAQLKGFILLQRRPTRRWEEEDEEGEDPIRC